MFDEFESLEEVLEKEGLGSLSAIENIQSIMDLLTRVDELTREEGVIENQLSDVDSNLVELLRNVNALICDGNGILHEITTQLDPSN